MSIKIIAGDCRETLKRLPDESIHCVVTSPPYFGLRDYGAVGQIGIERNYPEYVSALVEVFREVRRILRADGTVWLNLGDSYATGAGRVGSAPGGGRQGGKWAGYRGTHTRENSGKAAYRIPEDGIGPMTQPNLMPQPGLKPKDLIGIPWRVALALQDDGWWLRRDIIWNKPSGMPESVRDRPATGHEYVFLLSKSATYFYDAEAVKLAPAESSLARWTQDVDGQNGSERANGGAKTNGNMKAVGGVRRRRPNGAPTTEFVPGENTCGVPESGVNLRSVWIIPTQPFSGEFCRACRTYFEGESLNGLRVEVVKLDGGRQEHRRWCDCGRCDAWLSHFATFPPALIEPCIKAGTSERGCCAKCGAPWAREVERRRTRNGQPLVEGSFHGNATDGTPQRIGATGTGHWRDKTESWTLGWSPSCSCGAGVVPATVLDPFAGAGTTGLVADRLGRDAVLIELNPDYAAMAEQRFRRDAGLFADVKNEKGGQIGRLPA